MDNNTEQVQELIIKDFELESVKEGLTEEELFDILANQIAYMIERQLEMLMSLMYRLDIDEKKVNYALSPFSPDPPNIGIAKLVLERQKQRVFTKAYYKQKPLEDLDGLEL
jgi:hypothetical protein